jgi:hypothetical protein
MMQNVMSSDAAALLEHDSLREALDAVRLVCSRVVEKMDSGKSQRVSRELAVALDKQQRFAVHVSVFSCEQVLCLGRGDILMIE